MNLFANDRCASYPPNTHGAYRTPKARGWYAGSDTEWHRRHAERRDAVCPQPAAPLPASATRAQARWELREAYGELTKAQQRFKAGIDGASAVTKAEWRVEQARKALRDLG